MTKGARKWSHKLASISRRGPLEAEYPPPDLQFSIGWVAANDQQKIFRMSIFGEAVAHHSNHDHETAFLSLRLDAVSVMNNTKFTLQYLN